MSRIPVFLAVIVSLSTQLSRSTVPDLRPPPLHPAAFPASFSPSNLAFLDCFPASSSRQESIYSIVDIPSSETAPVSDPSSAQHPTTPPSATLRLTAIATKVTEYRPDRSLVTRLLSSKPSPFLLSVTLVSGTTIPVLSPAVF